MIPGLGQNSPQADLAKEAQVSVSHGTVLIVDESIPVRSKLLEIIQKLGSSASMIIQASTAEEAIAAFRAHKPHVIFAELIGVHPEDGLEIVHQMLEEDPTARVVLVTAEPRESNEVRDAIRAGAFAYVEKPVRYEKIRAVLADLEAEEGGVERFR